MLMGYSYSGWHLTSSIFNHSTLFCAVFSECFQMPNCLWMVCIWKHLGIWKHSLKTDAQLFMDGMHLALVGPRKNFSGASVMLGNLHRLTVQEQGQATGDEGAWTWLGRYWGPISESSGPVQDEWVPYIEFKLPRARYDGSVNLATLMLWLLQRHPDADAAMKILGIGADDKSRFGRAYVATELTVRAWVSSIQGDAAKAGSLIWLAYQANPQDHWIANALADNMMQRSEERRVGKECRYRGAGY